MAIIDSNWFNYLSDSYRGSVQTTEPYIDAGITSEKRS